jgi:hypothetical protein
MPLTISQLFNPVPSGVSLDPNVPAPDDSWLGFLLTAAQMLGLPTTAWQAGGPERTIDAIMSVGFAQEDILISLMAQGGFLDFAASGTVTSTALNGVTVTQPVTPDPSIPSQNPSGAPGWLDALGQSFFNVTRLQATHAKGDLAIVNTLPATLSYIVGNYHVANTATGATYSNAAALSVPTGAIAGTGGVITAVTVGVGSTVVTTNTAHGLSPNTVAFFQNVNGVTGINGKFALITSVTATTLTVALSTSGTWTSGGNVYSCTVASFYADVVGIQYNAAPGAVTTAVTSNPGVYVVNLTAWSAANYESNTNYAARCRLSLGARSPNGPSQAYEYFALTAASILAAQTPFIALTNGPIAKAISFANPVTEVETVVLSSSTPASVTLGQAITPGCAQLGITAATNATPIAITTASPHGLVTGNVATISGVTGNTAANQTTTVTVTGASTFTIDSSVGNGAYTGGGFVDGGDLGQVDALLQENVVPDNTTALTVSSLAFPVTVVATVVVPQAFVQTYQTAAPIALANLLASYPIGGNIPPGGSAGTIPITAVEGALVEAGVLTLGGVSYVRQITSLTVNGVTTDVTYPAELYDASLVTPTLTVVGV